MLHGNCIVEAVDNGSSVLRLYKEIRYCQINTVNIELPRPILVLTPRILSVNLNYINRS
jgi:hypothetical protein